MTAKSYIDQERERLRADYEQVVGEPYRHFFCPILLEDVDAELCMGHVINESIPNSCRKRVLQVKAVDGFYGSLIESGFATLLDGKKQRSWRNLFDKKVSQRLRPKIEIDGANVSITAPGQLNRHLIRS